MLFSLTDSPPKLKLKVIHDTLIILFYVRPKSTQLQRLLFLLKTKETSAAAFSPQHLTVEVAD